MVHRGVGHFFRLIGVVGVALLLAAAWISARLSQGPLSLSAVIPVVESALSSPDRHLSVRLEAARLRWDRERQALSLEIGPCHIQLEQREIAMLPEVAVTVSGQALLHGDIVLHSARIARARIQLLRNLAGDIDIGLGDDPVPAPAAGTSPAAGGGGMSPALRDLLAPLLQPPAGNGPLARLETLEIADADITLADQRSGQRWQASHADIHFRRDGQGLTGSTRLELDINHQPARVTLDGRWPFAGETVRLELGLAGMNPQGFSGIDPLLEPLRVVNLPFGGWVTLEGTRSGQLTQARFEITAGAGTIDASRWQGGRWDIAAFGVRGALDRRGDRLMIDELRADLGDTVLKATLQADNISHGASVVLDGGLSEIAVNRVKQLWPEVVAPNARGWIEPNLENGQVLGAQIHLKAHLPPGKGAEDLQIDHVGGEILTEGVTVHYLEPMPAVQKVRARCSFSVNDFTIVAESGELLGLKLQPGSKVVLGGLASDLQTADIDLKIAGPIRDALTLIDHKPLGWAKELGVEPATVRGDAITELSLKFPLLKTLLLKDISVKAKAQTSHAFVPDVALGLDFSEGALLLDITAQGMDVSGTGRLGGIAADLRWRENFTKSVRPRSRYQVQTVLDDDARRRVGLETVPFQSPFLSGPVPVTLDARLNAGGEGDIDIAATLDQVQMELPGLNWEKTAGTRGTAKAQLRLEQHQLAAVPSFAVTVAEKDFSAAGQVDFVQGHADQVHLSHVRWSGGTEASGRLALRELPGGVVVRVQGPHFDAREIITGHRSSQPPVPQGPQPATRSPVTPLQIDAHFDHVQVSDSGQLDRVQTTLQRNSTDWQKMQIQGVVGAGEKPVQLTLTPATGAGSGRILTITSADAGAALKAFDFYDTMVGGALSLSGQYDDRKTRPVLLANLKIDHFQLVRAPLLARMLSIAALTGIVDLLTGDGIHFDQLKAGFEQDGGIISVHDARVSGTELGLTARGRINFDSRMMDLRGVVIPAYLLNSLAGRLPVVGEILTGERGGGIIAMNYRFDGPVGEPSVTVNPLSVFTPGVLRRFFDLFSSAPEGEKTDAPAGGTDAGSIR